MARKPGKVTTWSAIAIVVAIVAGISIWRPGDRFRSAWAFGDQALVGDWQGTIETPTGKRYPFFLTLTFHDTDRGRRTGRSSVPQRGHGRFDGQAIVCEGPGKAVSYAVDGAPKDRHGSAFGFFTEAVGRHDGITPGHFQAAWDGKDAIRGTVQYSWRHGTSAISGADYPDTQGEGTLSLERAAAAATPASCAAIRLPANPSDGIAQTGAVTDAAHILNPDQVRILVEKLQQVRTASGDEIAVATVPSLGGQDIGVFARNLVTRWKIGHPHMDDGILLLVAPSEHQARIAVGTAIQHRLPGPAAQQIMDGQILPRLRRGDYRGGLAAGIDAVARQLAR